MKPWSEKWLPQRLKKLMSLHMISKPVQYYIVVIWLYNFTIKHFCNIGRYMKLYVEEKDETAAEDGL